MRFVYTLLLPLLVLTACATPDPVFIGATRHEVTLQGIDFVVFHQGNEAEVVRMGYLGRARRAAVPMLMMAAVEAVTGCAAIPSSFKTRIPGDTGEARLRLRCASG